MKDQKYYREKFDLTLNHLQTKEKVLFLTTSNRWDAEKPKSTKLALKMAKALGPKAKVIDASKLKIFPCEGNVSSAAGNSCGAPDAKLRSGSKNPSGHHRCWASINNPSDELWRISRELLQSDCVVFFGSIRWGQMNSIYQKLIERLTWLENRHTTLGEENILNSIEAGLIATGHNWNAEETVKLQKKVLDFFGFKAIDKLFWSWQFVDDEREESRESYKKAAAEFEETFKS